MHIFVAETSKPEADVLDVNIKEEITISLMSKNTSARDRLYEVPMALNSFYSRHLQAQNKMHIAILGEAYDSSFLEETSMFNRWDIRIRVFRSYAKIKSIDYYDKFPNTAEFEAEYHFDKYEEPSNLFGYDTKFILGQAVGFSTAEDMREGIILDKTNYNDIFK